MPTISEIERQLETSLLALSHDIETLDAQAAKILAKRDNARREQRAIKAALVALNSNATIQFSDDVTEDEPLLSFEGVDH